jgi:dTDP-4-dehydrorhamnose 3,5-epimerase
MIKKEELKLSEKDTKQPKLFDIKDDNEIFEFGVNYYA